MFLDTVWFNKSDAKSRIVILIWTYSFSQQKTVGELLLISSRSKKMMQIHDIRGGRRSVAESVWRKEQSRAVSFPMFWFLIYEISGVCVCQICFDRHCVAVWNTKEVLTCVLDIALCQYVEKVNENILCFPRAIRMCFLGLFAADMLLWQMHNTVEF